MTVIGVGRDITWFLVSSPAVMRKNVFPDALTQWDGHCPEKLLPGRRHRSVLWPWLPATKASAHDRLHWRGSHAPTSESRQSYAQLPEWEVIAAVPSALERFRRDSGSLILLRGLETGQFRPFSLQTVNYTSLRLKCAQRG